ncbi:MAG: hypothetical protein H8E43_06205 [Planctomycetia bacterium]|nr:hypothetical protein [Planctomycetia bacterium]MBL6914178.1 hypothetical protein [Planctomycetota bacterium]HCW45626.1 hypothetical protein [Planctomycetota bacterium]
MKMMTDDQRKKIEIRQLAGELSGIMNRLHQLHEELSQIMVDLDESRMQADYETVALHGNKEYRVLSRIVDEERQRLIIGEELGDILGLEIPSQVTVEDVIPYVDDELAKKFRSLRDGIRRQSCELRAQNRLGEMLHGQVFEHVEVYLSPGTRAWVDTTENLEQDRIEQGDSFEADF